MPGCCCEITDRAFTESEARADLKHFRKHGPAHQTRLLLDGIRALQLKDASLLDIGGGVGAIHHELLDDVARQAVHVDASSAYLQVAEEEAARRGNNGRVRFVHADFTDVASEIEAADIVTLDRVVCCYPDFRGLLQAAAAHGRRVLAMTYPRETWYMLIGLGFMNLLQSLRRDPFRAFVHPVAGMDAVLKREGYARISLRRLFAWEMALYQRTPT